jgi:hypothetical protein
MNAPNLKKPCPPDAQLADWSFDQSPVTQTARLLALALPGASLTPEADAFNGLAALNDRLRDAPETEILEALTRQAALLEALFLSYTRRALEASKPDHAERFQGVALKIQKSHLAVLGAIRSMHEGKRNVEAITAD